MICCLCHKPLRRAVHELRKSGSGGRNQVWDYCRSCWAETVQQREYLAIEPMHGHSPLISGGQVNTVWADPTQEDNLE